MSEYTEFFLNSHSNIIQYETLEISHPDFTKVYRLVRNAKFGITATLEGGGAAVDFDYYPLQIKSIGNKEDLDQGISVALGDLGTVLPTEIDAVTSADGFSIKPTVKYRVYRSDDLSQPMFGPVVLNIKAFTFNRTGSVFEAKAPELNNNITGEIYSFERFPMLRAFL